MIWVLPVPAGSCTEHGRAARTWSAVAVRPASILIVSLLVGVQECAQLCQPLAHVYDSEVVPPAGDEVAQCLALVLALEPFLLLGSVGHPGADFLKAAAPFNPRARINTPRGGDL